MTIIILIIKVFPSLEQSGMSKPHTENGPSLKPCLGQERSGKVLTPSETTLGTMEGSTGDGTAPCAGTAAGKLHGMSPLNELAPSQQRPPTTDHLSPTSPWTGSFSDAHMAHFQLLVSSLSPIFRFPSGGPVSRQLQQAGLSYSHLPATAHRLILWRSPSF